MWLFVSSCIYEIPRLLSLLVLACIRSKDERDIPSKFGVSTPAFCIKCSPTLTGMLVLAYGQFHEDMDKVKIKKYSYFHCKLIALTQTVLYKL